MEPRRPGRTIRTAVVFAALGLCSLSGCAATTSTRGGLRTSGAESAAPGAPGRRAPVLDASQAKERLRIATRARTYEQHGDYAAALGEWRRLQPLAPADGDLELACALDEARTGQLESASARLSGELLTVAGLDTLPVTRFEPYAAVRESLYLNGSFDGWHWYVWRARAEVAAARGRWEEAAIAARQCVAARPASGKEWLLLATCAGRAGWAEEARAAVKQAVALDRGLPEAHYLAALWAWKDGRRGEAQEGFRAAMSADDRFRPAAVALVRSRLPGTGPDSLPAEFLTGPRAVGMLTSKTGPKLEDRVTREKGPRLVNAYSPPLSDSLKGEMQSRNIKFWLFTGADGRVVLHDLQWYPPGTYPTPVVSEFAALLSLWRFEPLMPPSDLRGFWVMLTHSFQR